MTRRIWFTTFGLLLLAVGILWLWTGEKPSPAGTEVAQTGTAAEASDSDVVWQPQAIPAPAIIQPPDKLAQGDWLVQAGPDHPDLRGYFESLGLKVRGHIPQAGVYRLSGPAAAFARLQAEGWEGEANTAYRLPSFQPEAEALSHNMTPGTNQWLAAMGLSTERVAEWGRGVRVAVLDSGLQPHPALPELIYWSDLIDSSAAANDPHGHGTAVAGLLASRDPFAPGLAPDVSLMAIRVLDSLGEGDAFTVARGIYEAVENGANVINLSLGGYSHSQVLEDAVAYAQREGVVIVAAVGNDNSRELVYPAALEGVIGVTSVDPLGNRAPYANYGEYVDISAPGWRMHALGTVETEYIYMDGTSGAASVVTAAVAAEMGKDLLTGNTRNAADVGRDVVAKADDIGPMGHDEFYGAGMVNPLRLENVKNSDFFDLAMADIYADARYAETGQALLQVNFQNRGAIDISGVILGVNTGSGWQTHYFGRLKADAVQGMELTIPVQQFEQGVVIQARVQATDTDQYDPPENNSRGLKIQLAAPASQSVDR